MSVGLGMKIELESFIFNANNKIVQNCPPKARHGSESDFVREHFREEQKLHSSTVLKSALNDRKRQRKTEIGNLTVSLFEHAA